MKTKIIKFDLENLDELTSEEAFYVAFYILPLESIKKHFGIILKNLQETNITKLYHSLFPLKGNYRTINNILFYDVSKKQYSFLMENIKNKIISDLQKTIIKNPEPIKNIINFFTIKNIIQ